MNNREQWSSKTGFILAAAGSAVGLGNIWKFPYIVGGWSVAYTVEALRGTFHSFETPQVAAEFFNLKNSNPGWVVGYHTIFFAMIVGIILSGIKAGVEKASKFLMPILFIILIVLVFQGLMLPDSDKGMSFLFNPDWSKINAKTFLLALGHAFFTLSLGMGAMMTYGSYLSDKDDVVNASYMVAFLDTIIAILAGVAIFTVVFSSGYDPTAGPGLVFHVLPPLLAQLPGGYIFALLFFLLLSIAAVTSAISILEVSVAYLVDELKFSRKKSTLIMGVLVYCAAIPCALSFNVLQDVTISVQGNAFTFFDTADYLASNILLPLGGFFIAIFAGYVWGVDEVVRNLLKGNSESIYFGNTILESSSSKKVFRLLIRYLSPISIFLVFLYQFGWI